MSILNALRRTGLCWALLVGGAVLLAPPTLSVAVAKAKAKAKGKAKGKGKGKGVDAQRDVPEEQDLEPKKDYVLDEKITKTKDLKESIAESKGPTLEAAEISRITGESLVDSKLDEQVNTALQILELQTKCEEAAPVRFRLADLYWEKAKRVFFKSEDATTTDADRKKLQDHMKKLQTTAVANYRKIVDECEGFSELPKVLFFLGSSLVELEKSREGAAFFQRIIKEYPQSEWVGNAWFMVGEYYFNAEGNVNENAAKALRAYKHAEEFQDSLIYGFSIYKQGWCYINTGDWDQAMERFQRVVTVSEDTNSKLDKLGRNSLRKEALKDYVRAFSNVGDSKLAFKTFMKVGGKDSVQWMMEGLGTWYIGKDAHNDTIAVYRELIKNHAKATRTPLWQGRIVDAVSKQDKKSVVPETKKLTEFFLAVRERVERGELEESEKKTVKRDLEDAEEIAENTLRRLAMDFHQEAKKLRGTSADRTFRLAHDLYRHYLTVFPKPKDGAEVNYVFYMRFYFAEVLYKLEQFGEAAENYDTVVDMEPHPTDVKRKEIVHAAAEESVRSYKELVEDLDRKNPPEVSGTDPKPIPEIKQKFIHACDRYIGYVGGEGEKIVPIRFMKARQLYIYNHFTEAAPAFNDIVMNHPAAEEACLAANLTLDIYNGMKDYASLRDVAHTYVENKQLSCGDDDRQKFAKLEEQAAFQYIKFELEDKKKHLQAAKEYLEYYKLFPKGEFADDAVYNAAVNYDLAQRLDQANEVRRFLVEKMPNADPKLVQETLYNIAASYERVVDFDNAAKYLEMYAQRYAKDDKSKDALFNAGLYRAQLKQYDEARRLREQFIKLYPSDPDVHKVAYANCEALEDEAQALERRAAEEKKQGEYAKAIYNKWEATSDCFGKYIGNKAYAAKEVDLVCHAHFRRGEIMRVKTKYDKGYWDTRTILLKSWPKWKTEGLEKVPKCATAMAEIDFRGLTDDFKKYEGLTISEINPADEKKVKAFEASVKTKVKERDALIEKYKAVAEYGVAEWALAALYHIGEAYQDSVDKLLQAPIPDKVQGMKLTDDIKEQLRQNLKDMTPTIVESAVEAYRICVNKASELGVYNKWSTKALTELQKLRPEEFPPVNERTEAAQFVDKLVVQSNNIVIPDGDSWRTLAQTIEVSGKAEASGQPAVETKKHDKAPAGPAQSDEGKKGKKGDKGKKAKKGKGDN